MWLALRIGLVFTDFLYNTGLIIPPPLPGPVFGERTGIFVTCMLFGFSVFFVKLAFHRASIISRLLEYTACLSPLLVLIWGMLELHFVWALSIM